ncbi:hypothetical protein VNO80_12147 [Phaseolus coccineus]|uniref:Uncharacterized protein n=1 Tax=Phaseolus coccineus TaxID=3886 RepID=A0AAN9NGH6_PHACN
MCLVQNSYDFILVGLDKHVLIATSGWFWRDKIGCCDGIIFGQLYVSRAIYHTGQRLCLHHHLHLLSILSTFLSQTMHHHFNTEVINNTCSREESASNHPPFKGYSSIDDVLNFMSKLEMLKCGINLGQE